MINKTEIDIMRDWDNSVDPVVSVCCATYNHEKYIGEAINGFLIQKTNFPFEIIIRDDCSTDETATIIETYADKFPNIIKTIFERENRYSKGIKPMPAVFKKAVGNYFALCEGDDYWTDPEKLQIQVNAMRDKPECYMSFHLVKEKSGHSISQKHYGDKRIFSTEEVIELGGYFFSTPSLMIDRRAVVKLPKFFHSTPVGDYYLQILGSINGGALYIDRVMSVYRVLSDGSWSSTQNNPEKRLDFCKSSIKSHDDINIYLNRKFEKSILKRKSIFFATIAHSYLHLGNIAEFKKYIRLTFEATEIHSPGLLLTYHLRNHPNLLLFIKDLKNSIIKPT